MHMADVRLQEVGLKSRPHLGKRHSNVGDIPSVVQHLVYNPLGVKATSGLRLHLFHIPCPDGRQELYAMVIVLALKDLKDIGDQWRKCCILSYTCGVEVISGSISTHAELHTLAGQTLYMGSYPL